MQPMIRQALKATLKRAAQGRLRRVVLTDHARLPGRFFGRMTAAVQAGL
jgi:hypothetical protein